MKRHFKQSICLYFAAITMMAAGLTLSPLLTVSAPASQEPGVATRLLGNPMEGVSRHFDSVRNRPSPRADLAKTFNERDYYREGRVASLGRPEDDASMFIDMRHDIDQATETWHGSAGVQIVW